MTRGKLSELNDMRRDVVVSGGVGDGLFSDFVDSAGVGCLSAVWVSVSCW